MTRYSWVRAIVEDPKSPGELLLDLGPEICEHLNWQEGDELLWIDNKDGSWTLKKKDRDVL